MSQPNQGRSVSGGDDIHKGSPLHNFVEDAQPTEATDGKAPPNVERDKAGRDNSGRDTSGRDTSGRDNSGPYMEREEAQWLSMYEQMLTIRIFEEHVNGL